MTGSDPTLIVVGTGRSGTKSMARLLQGEHEPLKRPTSYLAMARSHSWMSFEGLATAMSKQEYPEVISDYKQSELIDVTSQLWPDVHYLWVTRNPADTIASMVQKRWYLPSDDNYPPGYLSFWVEGDDRVMQLTAHNEAGNRTRGDLVGDFTFSEWSQMSQVERCGWWWNYCNQAIAAQLNRMDGDRFVTLKLEKLGVSLHENHSTAEPVTGWEPYVEQMAKVLSY